MRLAVVVFTLLGPTFSWAFVAPKAIIATPSCRLARANNNNDEKVEVGSKEYLEGFVSSPIRDDSLAERGTGLEQALKLGGSFAVVLALLFVGFMASNGLL